MLKTAKAYIPASFAWDWENFAQADIVPKGRNRSWRIHIARLEATAGIKTHILSDSEYIHRSAQVLKLHMRLSASLTVLESWMVSCLSSAKKSAHAECRRYSALERWNEGYQNWEPVPLNTRGDSHVVRFSICGSPNWWNPIEARCCCLSGTCLIWLWQ
jgi:hypothetical protein